MTRPRKQRKAKPAPMRRKARRIVLGVGHPWFFEGTDLHVLRLYKQPKQPGVFHEGVTLNTGSCGNWNKVRLVIEVLK